MKFKDKELYVDNTDFTIITKVIPSEKDMIMFYFE